MKTCPTCKKEKPLSLFNKDLSRIAGVSAQCKACRASKSKEYRRLTAKERRESQARWRSENAEHLKKRASKRRLEKRAQCLVAAARTRSRPKGVPFDLDGQIDVLQKIIDAGYCELSGVPFDMSPGRKANSPSLDRITPSLGYVPGNVRIVCHALNTALGDWGEDVLAEIAEAWLRKRKSLSKQP